MNSFKLARYESGLSVEQAAERAGVSGKTIRLYERGVQHPSAPTAKRLASVYGVTVRALLGEEAAA